MSHFTKIDTFIFDTPTLTSVLTRLDISWEKLDKPIKIYQNGIEKPEVLIQQLNPSSTSFVFNGYCYELVIDKSLWNQPWSLETLSEQINQNYSIQILNKQLKEVGFSTINYTKVEQGSIDVIADRWITEVI
mmetsp:Transcript_21697/g.66862  ORF Transcript_21697/g.66862 Transcript_21697/m.66862 type:complete len:132 (+) Transcript_21697:69-464(+)